MTIPGWQVLDVGLFAVDCRTPSGWWAVTIRNGLPRTVGLATLYGHYRKLNEHSVVFGAQTVVTYITPSLCPVFSKRTAGSGLVVILRLPFTDAYGCYTFVDP